MSRPPFGAVAYPDDTQADTYPNGKGNAMSEDTPVVETTEETPVEPESHEEEEKQAPDPSAEAKKWKAIALKHEAKAKELEGAAEKLKALETQNMSETEKLQAALAEFQEKARTAEIEALRLRVAQEKGLSPELAKFLPAVESEIDMVEAADELIEASGGSLVNPPTKRPRSLNHPLGDETDNEGEKLLNAMLGKPAR